jgi:DNA-binding transcriptional MerR regulator
MEYTIAKLAKMAGISTRTLRYYDEIGLLKPARIHTSNYRMYGTREVDRLQQILFYKAMGMELDAIHAILTDPAFDGAEALKAHHKNLLEKRVQIDRLIETVERTLDHVEGRKHMSDQEKFKGFKAQLIEDNEKAFGKEVRERYGDAIVDAANEKVRGLSKEAYLEAEQLAELILEKLKAAFETGDSKGSQALEVAELHKKWLSYYWPEYSAEAHAGVVRMYVEDPRFTAYYDKETPGMAVFLRDAVLNYLEEQA